MTFANDTISTSDELELRRVTDTSGGNVTNSQFVTDLSDVSPNQVTFSTASYQSGDYFVDDSGDDLPRRPGLDETFELRVQTLSTEFVDDSVDNAGDTTVDLDL
ncbi:hypothetical protein, partial [Halorubrum saccharovorum]